MLLVCKTHVYLCKAETSFTKVSVYDGLGKMMATVTKSIGGMYSVSTRRTADPSGVVRVGASRGVTLFDQSNAWSWRERGAPRQSGTSHLKE